MRLHGPPLLDNPPGAAARRATADRKRERHDPRSSPSPPLFVALALAGCLSTKTNPSRSPAATRSARGRATTPAAPSTRTARRSRTGRLIRLRRDGQTQYVFVTPDDSSAEPAALHRVADGIYLVAVAHAEGPGEDLYLAASPPPALRSAFTRRRRRPSPAARRLPPERRDLRPQPVFRRSFRAARGAARVRAGFRRRPQELASIHECNQKAWPLRLPPGADASPFLHFAAIDALP